MELPWSAAASARWVSAEAASVMGSCSESEEAEVVGGVSGSTMGCRLLLLCDIDGWRQTEGFGVGRRRSCSRLLCSAQLLSAALLCFLCFSLLYSAFSALLCFTLLSLLYSVLLCFTLLYSAIALSSSTLLTLLQLFSAAPSCSKLLLAPTQSFHVSEKYNPSSPTPPRPHPLQVLPPVLDQAAAAATEPGIFSRTELGRPTGP